MRGNELRTKKQHKTMEQNLQSELQKPALNEEMAAVEVVSAVGMNGELQDSSLEAFERKVERIKEVAARVDANLQRVS